jgi:conjugal transfer/entry exclusion protein
MKATAKMMERIRSLENEVSEKIKDREQLEQDLASAYETGADAQGILKKLGEVKDAISGGVAALKNLDERLYRIQRDEHYAESKKLDAEARARFEKTLKNVAGSMGPVKKALSDTISKATMPRLIDKLVMSISEDLWAAIDAENSELYLSHVPCMPSAPSDRDDEGKPVTRALV